MFVPKHGTALVCIDGRVQMPVIHYMKARFALDYVDIISEPGINRLVAEGANDSFLDWIVRKIRITLDRHGSNHIAVVGHFDCGANPAPELEQAIHTRQAIDRLRPFMPDYVQFCALWVNARRGISEIRDPKTMHALPAMRRRA